MKRQITISQYNSNFIQHITEPLIQDDSNAYEIIWQLPDKITDAQIMISAKRADEEVITDSSPITGTIAKITLKSNIYSVPGNLTIRIQIVSDSSVITYCQLVCNVLTSYVKTDNATDDRLPVLTSLISQANTAISNANAAAERIPTTEELDQMQAKLDLLENYDDTEIRKLISDETTARENDISQLSGDKADWGKTIEHYGIEDAYTKTEIDSMVGGESGLKTVAYEDLDTFYEEGIFRVVRKSYTENKFYSYPQNSYLLIVWRWEYLNEDGTTNETDYTQMLLDANGKCMTRDIYAYQQPQEWTEYIPSVSITQQSYISTVNSTVTTYTFKNRATNLPSAAYKISHTGTNTVTFEFDTPTSTNYTNEICIYFHSELENAVVWGSNVKFINDEIPTITANTYYRIIAEYNPLMNKWVIGTINDGKGE